jgi:hypothetical protein
MNKFFSNMYFAKKGDAGNDDDVDDQHCYMAYD